MVGIYRNPRPEGDSLALFWPGLIDLVTSALMVFLLLNFIQTFLNVDEIEALVIRNQQQRFLEIFRQEFRTELDSGELSVERQLNFLQVTFSDSVLFESGEHLLKARGESLLHRCAAVLQQAEDTGYEQIQVEGHTDSIPVRKTRKTYPFDNWQLSGARAISVLRFLTSEGGLEPEVLSANGYADMRPVASNDTAVGRSRNRRVELRIVFALDRPGQLPGDGA